MSQRPPIRLPAAGRAAVIGTPIAILAALAFDLATLGAPALTALIVALVLAAAALYFVLTAPPSLDPVAPSVPAAAPSSTPTIDQTGIRIGRYTLEERLAVGGMGEVWRASHDTLIRPAALKIIRRPPTEDKARDKEWIERFRREAMVTGSLSSPHTVDLYDFGVEGNVLYLAMELLDGMNLHALVETHGPLEEARVAFLLRQACHSLIEAHEGGIVHRDLKPENLLITRAGRDHDFLKVIDFGLVKQLTSGPTKGRHLTGQMAAVQLTALGARPGTPGYMAPEQIGGNVVDQRADIYALACVAYYALTGKPVFEGSEDAQLMFAHMEVDADRPSERLGRPIHRGLEDVIMRCLAKNPLQRPESMLALDDALAALVFDPPWTQARARQWWAAHPIKG